MTRWKQQLLPPTGRKAFDLRKIITPEEAERRLEFIFPRAAFDTVLSSPLAGTAVAALIYVDAVCNAGDDAETARWARPSTVVWISDAVLERQTDVERLSWRASALRKSKDVEQLQDSWGIPFQPKYRDNSRETLRDETFRAWREHHAIRKKPGIPVNSSKPTWSLLDDFADLFDPDMSDDQVREAAQQWRDKHMTPGTKLKALRAIKAQEAKHAVTVTLPDNTTRTLEPGKSSLIIKGVVEEWAPARMGEPVVLAISEPGDKVHIGDKGTLQSTGIKIDPKDVLPDVLMADVNSEPVTFWIIEAVASDGAVTEVRRKALLKWAAQQNIKAAQCSFLSAFESRNAPPAKKRLKDLAVGTWAWFADEPGHELSWYQMFPTADDS
ncbi:BsuBI/PstI family type II restriction endonuclease [Streptomyces sp. NPDC050538]|uniref:BsuBI/PstI family type II restriction endonuclease n=1 Tax=Streptomyces sp. NPDC050538 TaxID=3365627 RepID=UPI0037BCA08A